MHDESRSNPQATGSNNEEDFAREIINTLAGIIGTGLLIALLVIGIVFWSSSAGSVINQQSVTLSLETLKHFYYAYGESFFVDKWLPTISTFLVLFCTVLLTTRIGIELPKTSRYKIVTNNLSLLSMLTGIANVALYALFMSGSIETLTSSGVNAAYFVSLIYPTLLTYIIAWLAALAGAHMIAESRAVSLQKNIDIANKTIADLKSRFTLEKTGNSQEPKFWQKLTNRLPEILLLVLFYVLFYILVRISQLPNNTEPWQALILLAMAVIMLIVTYSMFIFLRISAIFEKNKHAALAYNIIALLLTVMMSVLIAAFTAHVLPVNYWLLLFVIFAIVSFAVIWLLPCLIMHCLRSKKLESFSLFWWISPTYRTIDMIYKRASYELDRDQKELQKLEEAARQEAGRQNRGSTGKRKWLRWNRNKA